MDIQRVVSFKGLDDVRIDSAEITEFFILNPVPRNENPDLLRSLHPPVIVFCQTSPNPV